MTAAAWPLAFKGKEHKTVTPHCNISHMAASCWHRREFGDSRSYKSTHKEDVFLGNSTEANSLTTVFKFYQTTKWNTSIKKSGQVNCILPRLLLKVSQLWPSLGPIGKKYSPKGTKVYNKNELFSKFSTPMLPLWKWALRMTQKPWALESEGLVVNPSPATYLGDLRQVSDFISL